jgi:hypothetical protein
MHQIIAAPAYKKTRCRIIGCAAATGSHGVNKETRKEKARVDFQRNIHAGIYGPPHGARRAGDGYVGVLWWFITANWLN